MMRLYAGMVMAGVLLAGCGGDTPATPEGEPAPVPGGSAEVEPEENLPMTNLDPLNIGAYAVQPMYGGDLSQGHINVRVTGKEVGVVRVWVGPEDAAGVLVVKADLEVDHYCSQVEMPDPIPADARLWVEIESPEGERLKGSVPLVK